MRAGVWLVLSREGASRTVRTGGGGWGEEGALVLNILALQFAGLALGQSTKRESEENKNNTNTKQNEKGEGKGGHKNNILFNGCLNENIVSHHHTGRKLLAKKRHERERERRKLKGDEPQSARAGGVGGRGLSVAEPQPPPSDLRRWAGGATGPRRPLGRPRVKAGHAGMSHRQRSRGRKSAQGRDGGGSRDEGREEGAKGGERGGRAWERLERGRGEEGMWGDEMEGLSRGRERGWGLREGNGGTEGERERQGGVEGRQGRRWRKKVGEEVRGR